MENATKALLMAAGILIAIIIISLAIVVYGRVTNYYQTKQRNISEEQLAAFNNQYSVYNRDDVTGFELVSLINKAIDFNQNMVYGANNTENTEETNATTTGFGYTEMKIDVKLYSPKTYYGDSNDTRSIALFESNKIYEYTGKNSGSRKGLVDKINSMQELEGRIEISDLNKLQSYASDLYKLSDTDFKAKVLEITKHNYNISKDDIIQYADYLTFKRGTYKCTEMEYDKYGQISYFKFEQVK